MFLFPYYSVLYYCGFTGNWLSEEIPKCIEYYDCNQKNEYIYKELTENKDAKNSIIDWTTNSYRAFDLEYILNNIVSDITGTFFIITCRQGENKSLGRSHSVPTETTAFNKDNYILEFSKIYCNIIKIILSYKKENEKYGRLTGLILLLKLKLRVDFDAKGMLDYKYKQCIDSDDFIAETAKYLIDLYKIIM
jgi:hypothetical protein